MSPTTSKNEAKTHEASEPSLPFRLDSSSMNASEPTRHLSNLGLSQRVLVESLERAFGLVSELLTLSDERSVLGRKSRLEGSFVMDLREDGWADWREGKEGEIGTEGYRGGERKGKDKERSASWSRHL
jgi:hypothetical protein